MVIGVLLKYAEDAGRRFTSLLPARHRRAEDQAFGIIDGDLLALQRNDRHDRLAGTARIDRGARLLFVKVPGVGNAAGRDQGGDYQMQEPSSEAIRHSAYPSGRDLADEQLKRNRSERAPSLAETRRIGDPRKRVNS